MRKGEATTDKDGNWKVTLEAIKLANSVPPTPAGVKAATGTLTICGKNKVAFKDIYIGDVWVCSGQSNMEMHLSSCKNAKTDIANSENPLIRLFTVPKTIASEPQTEFAATKNPHESKWLEWGPKTVDDFSAVGYYFGRDLQKAEGIPIGLIHSSWGGTVAEAWATKGASQPTRTSRAWWPNRQPLTPKGPIPTRVPSCTTP